MVPALTAGRSAGDWWIAGAGVALALICALFPWYIFFNQEKFGITALKFSGAGSEMSAAASLSAQPDRIGAPFTADEIPITQLDLFSTATVGPDEQPSVASLKSQPFPADAVEFRLVHVANGRAMIEDEDGIWIVQVGSILPDNSHVAAIDKRDGKWAIMTTHDGVITISE